MWRIWMRGRAELYNSIAKLTAVPITIPVSSETNRQKTNVTPNGTKSIPFSIDNFFKNQILKNCRNIFTWRFPDHLDQMDFDHENDGADNNSR